MAYNKDAHSTVESIVYDEQVLSTQGTRFTVDDVWMPKAQAWSPVYPMLTEPFTFSQFTSPRVPIDLGPFPMEFLEKTPRVLRLTVKPAGSLEVAVPEELQAVVPMLTQVLQYERMVNEKFKACEIHITTDYSLVPAASTQRFPGWHVDGLQGGKFKEKLMAEHSYVVATNNPTEFCLQPFFVAHLDEDITNFFKAFDEQALASNIYRGLPNHLYLMDAYMVHRTPSIPEETYRGFLRITVANAPLPIEHNTLNPMLGQERAPFKLDIRDWLRAPDAPTIWSQYGLSSPEDEEDHSPVENQPLSKVRVQDIGEFKNEVLTVGATLAVPEHRYPKVQPHSPTYRDMLEPFEPRKYTNPRLPIALGSVPMARIRECPNVLRMPLKWWGEDEVLLPEEFLPMKALIMRVFAYDKCHNPLYGEQVAHITHDTRTIEDGKTHRFPGFHGDDLQGGAFPVKSIAAHSYIATSGPSTEFCLQPFFVAHMEDSHERHFSEFDKQAREENVYASLPDQLYLMDPYAVHRTPLDAGSGERTFLRITFSTPDMLLPHNTPNPMFAERQGEYDAWEMPHLDETRWTQASTKDVPYSMYGIAR